MKLIILISLAACVTAELLVTSGQRNTIFLPAIFGPPSERQKTARKLETAKGIRQTLDPIPCVLGHSVAQIGMLPVGANCHYSNFVQGFLCDC